MKKISVWQETAKDWPDPLLVKQIKNIPNFPYSANYIRNLITGLNPDKDLMQGKIIIGRFPGIRKKVLIQWLDARTSGNG